MINSPLCQRLAIFLLLLSLSAVTFSQDCVVDKETLRGTYSGDCKKGKASGKGKATGLDTYEGNFKGGLPDGQGVYTWNNGTVYSGKFLKGLRDGVGIITFKRQGRQDSVVEGFWKKDTYMGRYEKPYIVHGKTGSVREVDIEFIPDMVHRVKIIITNTTGGVKGNFEKPKYRVDNIQTLKGYFERMTTLESHLKSTESSLMEVSFPLRVKLNMQREEVEIELLEAGSYIVTIAINQ